MIMNLQLYIEDCSGCNHWSEYEFIILDQNGYLIFKCDQCNTVKLLTKDDLKKMRKEGL